jgi:hypothetical protein
MTLRSGSQITTMNHDPLMNEKLLDIWNQRHTPVLFRKNTETLLLRLPDDNRKGEISNVFGWIRNMGRGSVRWEEPFKCWKVPPSWTERIVFNSIHHSTLRYKAIYLIHTYNPLQICAPSCWRAKGPECRCSCLGAKHGIGNLPGSWHIVSDTFAFSWETKEYSCRLLKPIIP